MEKATKRPALGRGLGALIPGGSAAERKGVILLGIEQIEPNRAQPRRYFDELHILELSESIRANGILQPLLVRREGEGYAIVAGERRWRAAQRAGLRELPCIVRDVSEPQAFELALIENIQREDLNAIEEAQAYQRLIEDHGLTQEELAQRVGKDRSTVANALRLLRLPESIKLAMSSGALSMGHARALLALGDETDLRRAAEKVMHEALSVREVEQLVQRLKGKKVIRQERGREGSVQLRHVVEKLQRKLGTKVALRDRDGAGTVEIRYHSHAELDRILVSILGEG
ncbi:MAG TPA: ParB/RepB/Spo0J family partition protein [Myxococcales bacterium]|jgi:ParB family transcriptional regulator, chromosome partitioning protein|nr:ParB/RepB/Spo0J family partition protein [Myxococcales bacterium]